MGRNLTRRDLKSKGKTFKNPKPRAGITLETIGAAQVSEAAGVSAPSTEQSVLWSTASAGGAELELEGFKT